MATLADHSPARTDSDALDTIRELAAAEDTIKAAKIAALRSARTQGYKLREISEAANRSITRVAVILKGDAA